MASLRSSVRSLVAIIAVALFAAGCLDLDDYVLQLDAGPDAADAADAGATID
jgi:hypothetical protein